MKRCVDNNIMGWWFFKKETCKVPFGMTLPGRGYNAHTLRHGFTGHEKERDLAEGIYTTEYKRRKACNADPEEQAHHIIPRELIEESETLQEAINDGFDFNGAINGIALKKDRHSGSHPDYTEMVRGVIEQAEKNPKFKSAKEKMEWVANYMRDRIENSNGKINNITVE